MRICLFVLSLFGAIPALTLVLLTFIGFPRWAAFTEKLVGPEPEVLSYYTVTNSIAGKPITFEIVPRKLPHKLAPAVVILLGVCLQIFGVVFYFISRSEQVGQ